MRVFPAALLAVALGCESATAPVGVLSFARDVDNAGQPALSVTPGTIEHRGTFFLPCIPYHVVGHLVDHGSRSIEIHLVGDMGTSCWTMTGNTSYVTRVTQLEAGAYELRVIHSWPDTGRGADTVFNARVTVP